MRIDEDGTIHWLNKQGELIIKILRLNNEDYTNFRRAWISTLKSLEVADPELYKHWMGFPSALPNLRKLRPLKNSKPQGVSDCYYEQRKSGKLPEMY
jgi:hypothetical protein